MPAYTPLLTSLCLVAALGEPAVALPARPRASAVPPRAAVQPGVDGIFAAETEAAVRRFQQAAGLPVTGVVGSLTHRALGLRPGLPLRRGSRGPAVVALQRALLRRGYTLLVQAAPAPVAGGTVPVRPALRPAPPPPERAPEPPRPTWSPPVALPVLPPAPPAAILEPLRPVPRQVVPRQAVPDVFDVPEPVDPLELPSPARPTVVERAGLEAAGDVAGRPSLEADGGTWLVPTAPGATTVDLARPAVTGGFAYWRGDWGLDGGFTLLPDGRQLFDARGRWRDAAGQTSFGVGWRGILLAAGPTHLGTFSLEGRWPLLGPAAGLEATGLWGLGLPLTMVADGYLGLAGRLGPVRLRGGWRGIALTGAIEGATLGWHGPVVGLQLPL
ncbi:MAG: peptidoglycan-binding domain-containing protein [Candidatus Sericytochromatia bacterium]|nr:peptidoglycan-binding domain-containing protein [Candidatus Sericytochromatia bacterium]